MEGGQHEGFAEPTSPVSAKAAELDRLVNIRPRLAPLLKEKTIMESRMEAIERGGHRSALKAEGSGAAPRISG